MVLPPCFPRPCAVRSFAAGLHFLIVAEYLEKREEQAGTPQTILRECKAVSSLGKQERVPGDISTETGSVEQSIRALRPGWAVFFEPRELVTAKQEGVAVKVAVMLSIV